MVTSHCPNWNAIKNTPNADTSLFHKADKFFCSSSCFTWWCTHWHSSHTKKIVRHHWLSGWLIHQLDTIIALVYIALAFLSSIQQERALKHAFIVLNGMSTHCHAYWKYRGSTVAPSIHLSKIFWSHFPGSFWGEIATEKQKEVIESLWGGREGFEINTKITHS